MFLPLHQQRKHNFFLCNKSFNIKIQRNGEVSSNTRTVQQNAGNAICSNNCRNCNLQKQMQKVQYAKTKNCKNAEKPKLHKGKIYRMNNCIKTQIYRNKKFAEKINKKMQNNQNNHE